MGPTKAEKIDKIGISANKIEIDSRKLENVSGSKLARAVEERKIQKKKLAKIESHLAVVASMRDTLTQQIHKFVNNEFDHWTIPTFDKRISEFEDKLEVIFQLQHDYHNTLKQQGAVRYIWDQFGIEETLSELYTEFELDPNNTKVDKFREFLVWAQKEEKQTHRTPAYSHHH